VDTGGEYFMYDGTKLEILTGGGALRFNNVGFQFQLGGVFEGGTPDADPIGLVWKDTFSDDNDQAYMRVVPQASPNLPYLEIVSGGPYNAYYCDFFLRTQAAAGTGGTRTPICIRGSSKLVGIYQSVPLGTFHIRQDNAAATYPVLILEQEDVDAPYIRFLDATIYEDKSEANEYIKVQLGGSDRFIRLYT
jgi:hypothetical protein